MSTSHRQSSTSRKRSRRPFEHHSGNYRMVDPSQPNYLAKSWEWTPRTTHELPLSPIKPVFAIPPEHSVSSPLSELTRSNHARSPVQLNLNTNPNMTALSASSMSSPTSSLGQRSLLGSPEKAGGVVVMKLPNAQKEKLWKRFIRFLTTGSTTRSEEFVLPLNSPSLPPPKTTPEDKVQPNEWKQYGYWAKPHLNRVFVDNEASTLKPISSPELHSLITSLRTENTAHPQNWIPGTTHPSLPPKPTRWKKPVPGAPLPFPWEVQLNPLLKHHIWGESPLKWYIARDPDDVEYALAHSGGMGGRMESPCQPSDLAQPATYPFLTHMHMNAIAGDTAPSFPWAFTIKNEKGIKVGDVLNGIFRALTTPVNPDERSSWPIGRQRAAHYAWVGRIEALKGDYGQWGLEVPPELMPMLRCDAMGGVMWFRGIEPSVNGGGWMITLGTH